MSIKLTPGDRIGKRVVVEVYPAPKGYANHRVLLRCDCGNEGTAPVQRSLLATKSCRKCVRRPPKINQRCSICRERGHNRQNCPRRDRVYVSDAKPCEMCGAQSTARFRGRFLCGEHLVAA